MQQSVRLVEKIVQSFARLNRSTSVTITGAKFRDFFKQKGPPQLADKVWAALVAPPPGIAVDMVVAPHCRDMPLTDDVLLKFYLNARAVASERNLKRLVGMVGLLSYSELPAEDFLTTTAYSAEFIAGRVVDHSVYMCAVLLAHFDERREAEIRAALEARLVANGSTDSKTQAAACPIIALSSLALLVDTQRCHLIIDSAHLFGTEEHGQWAAWALPLRERGILQSVDLVGAVNLASTRPGFCTVHELVDATLGRDDASLRHFAQDLLDTRLGDSRARIIDDTTFARTVRLILQKGRARVLLVISRLAHSTEQRDNAKFMQGVTPPGVVVKHVALLGHDEFALAVAQQVAVFHGTSIVVLRGAVADKFNLRDWISFLAALPRGKAVVLVPRSSGTAGLTLSDYIASARLPRRPELTWNE
jgi:hypothetical protein